MWCTHVAVVASVSRHNGFYDGPALCDLARPFNASALSLLRNGPMFERNCLAHTLSLPHILYEMIQNGCVVDSWINLVSPLPVNW